MSSPFSVPSPADFTRSIFVDNGPITKPPLTMVSGTGASLVDSVTVTLPGGLITSSLLGLYLTLSGSSAGNNGTFRITSVLSTTSVRVNASFNLPDTHSGSLTWTVFDPRNGHIADSPSDVTVTINSLQVTPVNVIGLLGQIVLQNPPNPTDHVQVSYSWVDNPTVDIRRLNSSEFRLNSWNRDVGYNTNASQDRYRYNNVLVTPSEYVSTDIQSVLAQPIQRDLKYRAYERAYTAVLNDPNLLLLNSPFNKIAFPPLSRPINSTFVTYGASGLPENDPVAPWTRTGQGTASVSSDLLTVIKTTSGPYPTGQVLFWNRPVDLTFPHVFAAAWRGYISSAPTTEGVFTGVAAGYSDESRAIVLGFLNNGGTTQIGLLVSGGGNDPSVISAWAGGLDVHGNPTGAPVAFDWTTIHSFRIFRDLSGTIHVYIDGDVTETLRLTESQVPFLEELTAPFNKLQGAFFGSLSRVASNTSVWEFFRYSILPTNPQQTVPSVFINYEGTTTPESALQPWTPIGYAGTETILSGNYLLLDSTSATTNASESLVGLVGGDFKGYDRIEPLLSVSSDVVLDVNVQLRTFTHGIAPNAVTAAIDDGNLLVQLSFFPDQPSPKISYGGRSLPTQFTPYTWSSMGGQTGAMYGRTLRITDTSTTDALLYFIDDTAPISDPTRVVSPNNDYILEFRALVRSFTADSVTHFCGANSDIYDGVRSLGVMLTQISGVLNVTLHSEGSAVQSFPFNWNDGNPHTYRLVKSTSGNLVSLFIDSNFIGSATYSSFSTPVAGSVGVITFGSSTPASVTSTSTVDWIYCNVWRVLSSFKKYVGIWKGFDPNALTGYHLPLKASGGSAQVSNNALGDNSVDFIASGVVPGDYIVVDVGADKGAYQVVSVAQHVLTIGTQFLSSPTNLVSYRIPAEIDWTQSHRYRVVRDPSGAISLLLDTITTPQILIGYNGIYLPQSQAGFPRTINGPLPSIVFGAFDPTNLSQTSWDFVRYGITRSPTNQRIAPPHQILNQRNVIASPEHLFTNLAHTHTDFWSSSTGIPPELVPDFLQNPGLVAYTLLNEGTPLVPSTQTFEVRRPTVQNVPIAGLNIIDDVLNSPSFVLNEATFETQLVVPNDVLYNNLQVIERDSNGVPNLLAPMYDRLDSLGTISYQYEVCLEYLANVLPENDTTAITPWTFQADNPTHVTKSAFNGVLTYGTDSVGTRTVYRNNTPLPDAVGLATQVTYTIKLLSDATLGLGDTQVRFGLSAPGMTLALGFVTAPLGDRYVLIFDQNSGQVVGGRRFDFLDNQFHTYRLVRDPTAATISLYIDS